MGFCSDDEYDTFMQQAPMFERMLVDEGTTVLKCFLHVSKDVQRQRLQDRVDTMEKRWKFRSGDLDDRAKWDAFQKAYAEAISSTSTAWAPWYVVPADRNCTQSKMRRRAFSSQRPRSVCSHSPRK